MDEAAFTKKEDASPKSSVRNFLSTSPLPPPSSSHHLEGHPLVAGGIAGNDLLDGDIGTGHKAHQAHRADEAVLEPHPPGEALVVEGEDLQQRRDDEGQGTAADGAHQGDDQVQLWDQDGQSTCQRERERRREGERQRGREGERGS